MIEYNWIRWCDFDICWYLKDDIWTEGRLELNMEYNEFYSAYLTEPNGKHIRHLQFWDVFEQLKHNKPDPEYDDEEKERLVKLRRNHV